MEFTQKENTPVQIQLREVIDSDLAFFYRFQLDPVANRMAAFTTKDPADHEAFLTHWENIRKDESVKIRTVLYMGEVAGSVLSYVTDEKPEVSYWIGREYWGRGIATRALTEFLLIQTTRPVYARVARDNFASVRILEKCGFVRIGTEEGFANARGEVIEEY